MIRKLKYFILPAAIVLLFFSFYLISNLLPELLWFDSFGFQNIWWFVFKSKIVTFSVFFLIAFLFLGFNVYIARNVAAKSSVVSAPRFITPFPILNEILHQSFSRSTAEQGPSLPKQVYNILLSSVILLLAVVMGLIGKNWWQEIYAFLNQTSFSLTDPIFDKDVGFYIFVYPILSKLQNWISFLIVASIGLSGWVYFSKKLLILIFSSHSNTNKHIKTHMFFLIGLFFATVAVDTWLQIYGLLYSSRGIVFGAGYTDIFAQLIGFKLLFFLLLIQALIFIIWGFRKGIAIPIYFLGVIIAVAIVVGKIYPGIIQNYVVTPNELLKEKPFIDHNIKFTRQAYQLDKIEAEEFAATHNLTAQDIANNPNTINNIRLWNQQPLKQTFSQLQEIRLYYEFFNIDVDRYMIDGSVQQVMLSPRELDIRQLTTQAQTWTNQHLVYTHGYGACVSPVNKVTKEGLPFFLTKDIPPVSHPDLPITRPEIYFGEKTDDYIIVNTKQKEFDYPKGDTNVYTNYFGKGGILLDQLFKRVLYAIKFSDIKILISPLITSESRILYDRRIRTIAEKLAPFLIFDRDPYMVITKEGRMVWMLDAYTSSKFYPYSEPFRGHINYIRNAVKMTIDAFSGEVNFYVIDDEDPIMTTFNKIYDGMFQPFSAMPQDLQQHIRYPKDLFTVQAYMYSTYHMTDSQVFYNREDLWAIPKETYEETEQVMDAYYMVTKIPGDESESFVLMLPFTPTNKNNMIAWLGARCDLDNYGQLKVFKFPKKRTIYGPSQIESRIDQDTEISQKLTLWGQVGSRVIRGNLMVVPIENSLIYVEPIYLQATQSKLPELKRVIFAYHNSIVMSENLDSAIAQIFEPSQASGIADITKQITPLTGKETIRELIDKLGAAYSRFKASARQNNWEEFGRFLRKIENHIQNLVQYDEKNEK